ncbi:glycosyl transferase family group 2-domain-containing protein [Papiliotrema laurentii]|uniref:Glycosyl transferase family group 2-domain-containing protein n=1 Tax=Papiliotrema laurentii TaxID=5418 RepID=A0AAD9FU73_PAPLA|nr:glycosyl transferase family group 2-domain-containing protein [Papiliotrema laurentii]
MSSFLRRLSHAVLPNVPNAAGLPAPHVPRRATETYTKKVDDEADSDTDSLKSGSRASWELSEDGSDLASSQSGSDSDSSGRRSFSDDSTDSDDSDYGGDERRTRDRFDMMTRYLWSTADRQGWFRDADFDGLVSIRVKKRLLRTYPQPKRGKRGSKELARRIKEWDSAVGTLNPEVAMKITSKVVQAIMARCPEESIEIMLDVNTRIQILDELSHLAGARKHQFAAFCRKEQCLVVWADEVETLIPSIEALEQRMLSFVWSGRHHELAEIEAEEKGDEEEGWVDEDADRERELGDLEEKIGAEEGSWEMREKRPTMLYAPLVSGLAIILCFLFIGSGMRNLVKEALLDRSYARFALMATAPFGYLLGIFFCICICGNIWQMFGPVAQCHQNSSYYSGKQPKRMTGKLPHITIQMPVYKEGLEGVIIPTVESLKKAITTYERQGGSVNIFIFDDGMQIWDEEEQEIRKAYYDRNNIGWTARPKHGADGYIRKGRFKKASNMNFGNRLSLRVEEIMDEGRPEPPTDPEEYANWEWTGEDEQELYEDALAKAIEESNGVAWAAGNIRIGELILIIDSDTRVPEDCFLDAASEFHQSPNIAIIQHESAVMQVVGHFFENGITSFTTRINSAISFCAANGEVAPFVGHNAFLRWKAIQDAAFIDEDDGLLKCWSESHVSEDFDQALRLQMKGWSLRWASYSNGGFQEGVSLTADDELNRWQKYAYGCSELLFQPLRKWFQKGPITPLYKRFVWADGIPLHSKISVLAYISSYYAIACALALSLLNWVLVGLFSNTLDLYYLESWQVFLTCIVIFSGLSNISSAIFQYRLNTNSLGNALINNFKWVVFFFFFFCGLSWHLTTALLAHLTGYNMQWASTIKEVELSHFFKEWPAMWKRFWDIWIVSWVIILGVAIMASPVVPVGYRITNFTCILPIMTQACCHFLYPIVLNPWLLLFQF